MILSLIASGYVLVGGSLAALVVAGDDHTHPLAGPLKPAPAFTLVVGTIVLWPVLLALAVDEGVSVPTSTPSSLSCVSTRWAMAAIGWTRSAKTLPGS